MQRRSKTFATNTHTHKSIGVYSIYNIFGTHISDKWPRKKTELLLLQMCQTKCSDIHTAHRLARARFSAQFWPHNLINLKHLVRWEQASHSDRIKWKFILAFFGANYIWQRRRQRWWWLLLSLYQAAQSERKKREDRTREVLMRAEEKRHASTLSKHVYNSIIDFIAFFGTELFFFVRAAFFSLLCTRASTSSSRLSTTSLYAWCRCVDLIFIYYLAKCHVDQPSIICLHFVWGASSFFSWCLAFFVG